LLGVSAVWLSLACIVSSYAISPSLINLCFKMLLKQLPLLVCAVATTWLGQGVSAQDGDDKSDLKSIPVSQDDKNTKPRWTKLTTPSSEPTPSQQSVPALLPLKKTQSSRSQHPPNPNLTTHSLTPQSSPISTQTFKAAGGTTAATPSSAPTSTRA